MPAAIWPQCYLLPGSGSKCWVGRYRAQDLQHAERRAREIFRNPKIRTQEWKLSLYGQVSVRQKGWCWGLLILLDSTSLVFYGASNALHLGGGEENSTAIFQESQLFTPTDSIANNLIPNIALSPEFPTRSQGRNRIHP